MFAKILALASICLFSLLLIAGCKSDDNPVTNPTTPDTRKSVELRFYPRFGSEPLVLNQKFLNAGGDSVWFTTIRFYLSETALIDTLGGLVPLEGDDHVHKVAHDETPNIWLVDFGSAEFVNGYYRVMVKGEPGKYRGIKFSVGVPYDLNHRDASLQDPPLGPNSGMYWSWNPGYIFHMMEGKADSSGTAIDFAYHLGTDNRKVTASLATLSGTGVTEFVVSTSAENVFSINVDYSKLFAVGLSGAGPMVISQNTNERAHHVGPANLADRVFANTSTMFTRRP